MILGRKGDVQWTVMDGEAVILNLATGIITPLIESAPLSGKN